jgi:hypothetical protein
MTERLGHVPNDVLNRDSSAKPNEGTSEHSDGWPVAARLHPTRDQFEQFAMVGSPAPEFWREEIDAREVRHRADGTFAIERKGTLIGETTLRERDYSIKAEKVSEDGALRARGALESPGW